MPSPTTPPQPAPSGGVRARRREQTQARILEVGREHLRSVGAAALSVRAVARDVGLAPSALFRYISGRDELLTLLIVDGYTSLGDAVDAALAAVPGTSGEAVSARWEALARSVRGWALEHPHQWALLYGSPVPDYRAPGETTGEPGTRVLMRLAEIGAQAHALGVAAPAVSAQDAALAERATATVRADPSLAHLDLPPVVLANGLQAWMLLVGAVSTEVYEGLGPDAGMPQLFEHTVATCRRLLLADG